MNDRYLFKAIDCNSIWRTGMLVCFGGVRCVIEESDGLGWVCKSKTTCQCTGFKDKNRNLIFEYDIVKDVNNDYGIITYGYDNTAAFVIKYQKDSHCFVISERNIKMLKFEIVGNIFDNPELLEVE